jgi:hypothetical protein
MPYLFVMMLYPFVGMPQPFAATPEQLDPRLHVCSSEKFPPCRRSSRDLESGFARCFVERPPGCEVFRNELRGIDEVGDPAESSGRPGCGTRAGSLQTGGRDGEISFVPARFSCLARSRAIRSASRSRPCARCSTGTPDRGAVTLSDRSSSSRRSLRPVSTPPRRPVPERRSADGSSFESTAGR